MSSTRFTFQVSSWSSKCANNMMGGRSSLENCELLTPFDLRYPLQLTTGTCLNGLVDGYETDVDCGGVSCPACKPGKKCKVSSDCDTKNCKGGVCVTTVRLH